MTYCHVHQDLLQCGTNPMVEVFDNRSEFLDSGDLLIGEERLVDAVLVSCIESLDGARNKRESVERLRSLI